MKAPAKLRPVLRLGLLSLLALVVNAPRPVVAEDASPARTAIAFRRQMRSKRVESRVDAVRKLAEIPAADAVDLLFDFGMSDATADVRQATIAVLSGYDDQAGVGKELLEKLNDFTRKKKMDARACVALAILSNCPATSVQRGVVAYLDEFLGTRKGDLALAIGLMDELGRAGDDDAVKALELMSRAKIFESHFGYRRSLVLAAAQIKRPSAIQLLIQLISRTDGLAQHDVVAHLSSVTGQALGNDDRLWKKWFNSQEGAFRFPEVAAQGQGQGEQLANDAPQYYGIPIYAKRVVFVLDTSGSMSGARILAAKRELIHAIEALPESVQFDVVAFNSRVAPWQPKLVPADAEKKKLVERAVSAQTAGGHTASYAALQAAFELDPEAIYFLSDGAPTDATPNQILTAITALNRVRRVSLHTIGIGVGFGPPLFGEFMKALAGANLGDFRAVNR